jgi:hypothetical protein
LPGEKRPRALIKSALPARFAPKSKAALPINDRFDRPEKPASAISDAHRPGG